MAHFNVGFGTDIGRKRQQNQDSGAACSDLGLFIVADGMGGHRGGETASALAVETIPAVVRQSKTEGAWDALRDAKKTIAGSIEKANARIYAEAQKTPPLRGMGTTTTAALFSGNILTLGHVGDSRCYYIRDGAIWQLTRDHSFVQERLRAGLITREQAKVDRMKNVITRSVGYEEVVDVETYEMTIRPGDCFLLCSDGLSGLISEDQMLAKVKPHLEGDGDLQQAAKELIGAANDNGGDDNITVILIQPR